MSLLTVRDLTIRYDGKAVVDGLTLTVAPGEAVGLVGESGSGKTQTALSILGLQPRNAEVQGSIRFDGKELVGAAEPDLDTVRGRRVAMIFQDPMQALNPYVRIGDQVRRIVTQHGIAAGDAAHARVLEMLERVGLPDPERQSRSYPHQLSGGMRQRAMIAAALITEPQLLIADEPTTALDVTVQAQILELLAEVRRDTALLLITHDLGVVARTCERLLVMCRGELVEYGMTREVFARPQHRHTRKLLAAAPRLSGVEPPGPMDTPTRLAVDAAVVRYRQRGHDDLLAVRDVDLELRGGETIAIVGESGSGKSSLVRAILGLVPAESGTVTYLGETLPAEVRKRSAAHRRDLQLVFQDPVGSLDPQMRVADIVAEPLIVHEPALDREERRARVLDVLDQVGLDEEFIARYPHELSGGQAQRVAIARALVVEPRVLVCDEAVAALDGTVREQILDLLRHIQRRSGLSILFISHDLGVVRKISHRVLVLYLGRLVELAENEQLFERPRHPYTRALIDAVPVPDPGAPRYGATLKGEVPSIVAPPPGCAFHPRCAFAEDRCSKDEPQHQLVDATTVACHFAAKLEL